MRLIVYGNPAPQGSKAFLGRTATGKGIIGDASKKTKPWRSDVQTACRNYIENLQYNWEPFSGALCVRMVFTFWRPASVKRRVRPYPSVYPDLSKLARSTEDALSAAGIWKDDALVVEYLRLAKVYVGEDIEALDHPGCLVVIQEKPSSVPLVSGIARKALEAA